jgi:hypothetical protein
MGKTLSLKSGGICFLALLLFGGLVSGYSQDLLGGITRKLPGERMRHSSGLFDPESNADAFRVNPGETIILAELEGPGEIRHIWFTLSTRDYLRYPRNLVLRMYWDESPIPSVETPVGDFFAAGHGMKANVSSVPVEATSYGRALKCHWRMPFRKKARLTITNDAEKGDATVYFYIDWQKLDGLPPDSLYFHARYNQEWPVKPFSPYTVIEIEGDGQYVGTVLNVHSSTGGWFGESDDRFYIDGEEIPRMVGTGFEDYITDAWNLRVFSNQFAGVTIREQHAEDARHTCYRWHITDPITFRKSLKFEVERRSFLNVKDERTGEVKRGDFKYRPDLCSSVAFWYQRTVATPGIPFPALKERLLPEIWVVPRDMAEPEVPAGQSILRASAGLKPESIVNKMGWVNFKRKIFSMRNDKIGSWLEIPFQVGQKGRYSISVFQILFKEYGVWKLSLTGPGFDKVLDPYMDFWNPFIFSKEHYPESGIYGTNHEKKVGVYDLEPGDYVFRFECVGSNPLSRDETTGSGGYSLGLDGISLRKLPWDDMIAWYDDYLAKEKSLQERRLAEVHKTIAGLSAALEAYKKDHGWYPQSLDSLIERPAAMNRRGGSWPYYKSTRIPLDPWGQRYLYLAPGIRNPHSFDLWSVCGDSRNESIWVGNWIRTTKEK